MTSSIQTAQKWLRDADAILVTASNGFSISEGLNLFANDQKLHDVLGDLVDKYQLTNLLAAMSFQYPDPLDQWRAYSRVVSYYSVAYQPGELMAKLKQLIADKPAFIWTSNVDHHFALAGLNNLLELEGNWLTGVCSAHPKDHQQVDLSAQMKQIHEKDVQGTLTKADLPVCQECGAPLVLNVAGKQFQMDQDQVAKFEKFIDQYQEKKLLVLELGIGPNNQMIKAPSMQLVAGNDQSRYITINKGQLMIPNQIADRSIGFSSTIDMAFDELITGKDLGASIQGPAKPQPKLSPKERAAQDKIIQQFYPFYMVDQSMQPGQLSMYLTIDADHPSHLHLVSSGQSWMYSMGDAVIAHCFSRDGKYYQVRLGLNKQLNELHGFYVDAGTVVAFENDDKEGAGFSQISGALPANGNNEILVPKTEELIKLFPQQKDLIQRLTANVH